MSRLFIVFLVIAFGVEGVRSADEINGHGSGNGRLIVPPKLRRQLDQRRHVPTGKLVGGTLYAGLGHDAGDGIEGMNTGRFTRIRPEYPKKGEPGWYPPHTVFATRDSETLLEGFIVTDANGRPLPGFLTFGFRATARQLGGKGNAEYCLVRAQNGGGYWVSTDPSRNPLLAQAFPPGFLQRKPANSSESDGRYAWVNLETDANQSVVVDNDGLVRIASVSLYAQPQAATRTHSPPITRTSFWDARVMQAGRTYTPGQWRYDGRRWRFYSGRWTQSMTSAVTPTWRPYVPAQQRPQTPTYSYPAATQPSRGYSYQPNASSGMSYPAAVCKTS